jgi:FtsP/CotA-like multicopper oxidase with cupredoxin domain
VWCDDFSIDTDYYSEVPYTGRTVEYWFEIADVTVAPDSYSRYAQAINGSIPGPLIEANWGDEVVVHLINSLKSNGSSIHFHGMTAPKIVLTVIITRKRHQADLDQCR